MKKYSVPLTILLAAAFIISGCGAIFPAPLATPLPPKMIGTEVVETSAALATQTAQNMPATLHPSRTPRPSETPRATQTPSITPSPTVPFVVQVPILYTKLPPTQTPNEPPTEIMEPGITIPPPPTRIPIYGAIIYSVPKPGSVFPPGFQFTARWIFINESSRVWDKYEVDFIYWKGEPMYDSSVPSVSNGIIDLPQTTIPGSQVTIWVPMKAPMTPGTYTTTWLLHEGNRYYALVSYTISVK